MMRLFSYLNQFSADDVDAVANEAYDVCWVDFDVAAIDHHVDGVLEDVPEFIGFVDVFVTEFCGCAEDGFVEMLEKFFEEGVRRDADADFRALDIEFACNVWIGGEDECVGAGDALLDDAECKVADAGVTGGKSDVGNDERHEEFFHGFLESVKLVDCLGGFGVAADGVAGFCRIENESVVFEEFGGLLYDACLRVIWMDFDSHKLSLFMIDSFLKVKYI